MPISTDLMRLVTAARMKAHGCPVAWDVLISGLASERWRAVAEWLRNGRPTGHRDADTERYYDTLCSLAGVTLG